MLFKNVEVILHRVRYTVTFRRAAIHNTAADL